MRTPRELEAEIRGVGYFETRLNWGRTDRTPMTEEPDDTKSPPPRGRGTKLDLRRPQVRVGAVVAVALLVGFVVWLVVRGGDSGAEAGAPTPTAARPVLVSAGALQTIAGGVNRPI